MTRMGRLLNAGDTPPQVPQNRWRRDRRWLWREHAERTKGTAVPGKVLVHVILLDSEYDLRRYPFAAESPAFLLPMLNQPLIDRTVRWLTAAHLRDVTLVTGRNVAEDFDLAKSVIAHSLKIAGSVREVLDRSRHAGRLDEPLLIMRANLDPLPDLGALLEQHIADRAALTWIRGHALHGPGQYTFGPPALAFAAPVFARLLLGDDHPRPLARLPRICRQRGLACSVFEPERGVVEIDTSYALYHANIDSLGSSALTLSAANDLGLERRGERLWVAPEVEIGHVEVDPTGGPVIVGWGADIGDGAILRGPTVIGEGVSIGRGSCVHRALLLDSTWLPRESFVANSVVSPRLTARVAV